MKLEKERLVAKVESLEKSLLQIEEGSDLKDRTELKTKMIDTQEETKDRQKEKMGPTNQPSIIPVADPHNPALDEDHEPMNS